MAGKKQKYYVVWYGREPGIYTSWEECVKQTSGFKGAKYKAYPTPAEAEQAFIYGPEDERPADVAAKVPDVPGTEKPQENDAIHTIYGKIINNRSVGNTLHYHIDVNGITFKVDTLFRSFALYKNDQNVWLSLEKRNCLALED